MKRVSDQDIRKIWGDVASEFRKRNVIQQTIWIVYAVSMIFGLFAAASIRTFLGFVLITHPIFWFLDWLFKTPDKNDK